MNRSFKKLATLCLVLGFASLAITNTVKADTSSEETKPSVLKNSAIPLYNNNNEVIAFHYELNNGGYIIVNSDGSDFIEYSLEETALELDKNKKYYYSDPCSIYEKVNNSTIEDCTTDEKIQIRDLDFNIEKASSCNQKDATALATSLISTSSVKVIEEKKLSHVTKKYNHNPDGRCGSVAGAIMLRYYNDYISTKYLPASLETTDGIKLIDHLSNNFLGRGTTYSKLKNGLNKYLDSRDITSRFYTMQAKPTTIFSQIMSSIKKDKPLILGLITSSPYGAHWVVATGYSVVYNNIIGNGYIVIFNDGWGSRNVRLNMHYVDGCIYIS